MNRLQDYTSPVNSVAFFPDGRLIISGSDDRATRILDIMDGSSKILATAAGVKVTDMAISSDGRLVATGSSDGVRDL